MSSAGLSASEPPQTKQPPSRWTTRRICSKSSATGVIVSITSAVPAGEVMALDDVFGIVSPAAVMIDTTIGVVRFPGNPPTQCLSAIGACPQSSRLPAASIARVRSIVSCKSIRPPAQALRKAAICVPG